MRIVRPSRRVAVLLVAVVALGLSWWLAPRPLAETQFRPPPGLPVSLAASGILGPEWSFVKDLGSPMNAMVRRSRGVSTGVLAGAIRLSASEALREEVRPVPDELHEHLARHYGRKLVGSIRWTVRGRRLELGSLLTAWVLEEGAVTLDRVIVFDNEALAGNLWLWAHEMAHVEQYQRLGVERFAAAYLADWQGMEAEATTRANAVVAAIRAEEDNAPIRWLTRGS